jgi:hypothetical protein
MMVEERDEHLVYRWVERMEVPMVGLLVDPMDE